MKSYSAVHSFSLLDPEYTSPLGDISILDPLSDTRWSDFIERHPHATVFHSPGWLEALRRTYDYKPLVVTTSPANEPLSNGMVLCKVRSWITGSRLVAVPFADHCEPLVNNERELELLITYLRAQLKRDPKSYLELRPLRALGSDLAQRSELGEDRSYYIHQLDLTPDVHQLHRAFHKSCVQGKIRKAEREGLLYEEGRSEELMAKFYKLLLRTRRRQQLPPQPMTWFRNLSICLGKRFKVRVVSKNGRPIASIITIRFGHTEVYKYGCSDDYYHNMGGMALLIWSAVQDAKASGARSFDFGRCERKNEGLATFKEHWGSTKGQLSYYRFPAGTNSDAQSGWKMRLIKGSCSYLPDSLLARLGAALYKHVG